MRRTISCVPSSPDHRAERSHDPDLIKIQTQPLRQLAPIQPAGVLLPFPHPKLAAAPDFHRLLVGEHKPAEADAIGLVEVHCPAKGGHTSTALVAGAR